MNREAKEPEIVAQMNLKYCHSTSLHLSPVDRRSSLLSIILPFVRALSLAEQFHQVRSFSSLVVFFLPRRGLVSARLSLPPKVAFLHDRVDRCAQPHIRAHRPYEFAQPGTTINRSEWRITIRLYDSNVILCGCRFERFVSSREANYETEGRDGKEL